MPPLLLCAVRRQTLRDQVARHIITLLPQSVVRMSVQSPSTSAAFHFSKAASITAAWRDREISNFEYIMQLNTLAGRTFSDITQYPVFPWILADYASKSLNTASPATYRDLSRPVGALSRERLEEYRRRYEALVDPTIPKFMYGHHYSTAVGTVIHYLLRMYPFTELHVQYQVSGNTTFGLRCWCTRPTLWSLVPRGVVWVVSCVWAGLCGLLSLCCRTLLCVAAPGWPL